MRGNREGGTGTARRAAPRADRCPAARTGDVRTRNGSSPKARGAQTVRAVHRDGGEPLDLATALGTPAAERAWKLPAAGATLRERWTAIAADPTGHVAAVAFDADAGRLAPRPESAAWATKTRLEQARVIAAANASAGRTVVRTLRIPAPAPGLVPGPGPGPVPTVVEPAPAAAPAGPVRTRESASAGYHRALAAHCQAARPCRTDRPSRPAAGPTDRRPTRTQHPRFPQDHDRAGHGQHAVPGTEETVRLTRRCR
ncbi:DciA family protein [Streptomyces sp. NPDC032161]|uniref:DciA family protein n=1 Tax=unclassified Streptomyces TaxID=2593676 RepID=UPI0033F0F641